MTFSRKKIGGVKNRTTETCQNPLPTTDLPKRKIGGVKTIPRGEAIGSGHMQSCPDNCAGEYVLNMWIHSRDCPWASVLWKAHGKTPKDWHCPFDCDPIEMSSGWTHPHLCPFWDFMGQIPFDHNLPRGVRRERREKEKEVV